MKAVSGKLAKTCSYLPEAMKVMRLWALLALLVRGVSGCKDLPASVGEPLDFTRLVLGEQLL